MHVLSVKVTKGLVVLSCLGSLAAACSSDPGNPMIGMLPFAVESWERTDVPLVVETEAELYNQIDGGAPKFTDRNWQGSVYGTYGRAGRTAQVAIHDMSTTENAQGIFDYDLPVSRVAIAGLENAVVDVGLPAAYSGLAFVDRYYIEVKIDDRSDAARTSVEAFVLAILDRARARS